MKPLKILFTVHAFFPTHFYGTETYTLELAQALKRLGHEAVILTATPYGEKGTGTLLSSCQYEGIPVHCIDLNLMPYHRFKDTYYRPDLYPLLREIVANVGPDIVHVTHLMRHSAVLLEVLHDANVPAVATLTDFYGICLNTKLQRYDGSLCAGPDDNSTNCLACYWKSPERPTRYFVTSLPIKGSPLAILSKALPFFATMPGLRKWPLSGRIRDVLCRLDTLRKYYAVYKYMIAPTDFLYDAYRANHFYPDKLRKIPFGISQELATPHQKTKSYNGSSVRFGYIGQITRHKGIDLLLRSYLRLRGDNKSLVICGPVEEHTPYMDELRSLSRGGSRIEFQSSFPREQLPHHLSQLDFLVVPSRWYENSPLVLLYALATKTPVIVTDVKGMNELVTDDVNGYTFKKESVEHLTSIMQKIVDDPRCIERLSRNAAYSRDVSDHARDVLSLYEASLGADREPRGMTGDYRSI
jgi:glycosyltransferase involved in cell wall biosynthesis